MVQKYTYTPHANYYSALEVETSSERRARSSPLHDRSAQKFQDLLKYPRSLDGTVISGIYIPGISRIVGSSARDCARFPCYFPAASERTGGCNPPNPPPGSAPASCIQSLYECIPVL